MNSEIEKMVIIKRDVRDRSDLGNQSIDFFLKLLNKEELEEKMFLKAIVQIAEKAGVSDLEEVKAIQSQLDWFEKISKDPIKVTQKRK